jgi:hypothetical protein
VAPLGSGKRVDRVSGLELAFPRLVGSDYRITSPATPGYNCIAWAVGESGRWWWPDPAGVHHWPDGVPRDETLDAFSAAFASLGFVPAETLDCQPGLEKVAVYARGGRPTHAARQLEGGRWTSKLGSGPDIEHDLPTSRAKSTAQLSCSCNGRRSRRTSRQRVERGRIGTDRLAGQNRIQSSFPSRQAGRFGTSPSHSRSEFAE